MKLLSERITLQDSGGASALNTETVARAVPPVFASPFHFFPRLTCLSLTSGPPLSFKATPLRHVAFLPRTPGALYLPSSGLYLALQLTWFLRFLTKSRGYRTLELWWSGTLSSHRQEIGTLLSRLECRSV